MHLFHPIILHFYNQTPLSEASFNETGMAKLPLRTTHTILGTGVCSSFVTVFLMFDVNANINQFPTVSIFCKQTLSVLITELLAVETEIQIGRFLSGCWS